jgi:hypothetical protein
VLRLPYGIEVAWWVGADDRWHIPEHEITIRHSLVGAAPVLRTAMRVPGGDAVATVAAMRQGQRDLAVLDVANESPSPFAVAYVLRGPAVRNVVVDGSTVVVSGRPILSVGRAPQFICVVRPGGDLLGALRDRQATKPVEGPVQVGDGSAEDECEVAVLVPLAHRSRVRAAALIGADSPVAEAVAPVISALKDPATAATGWSVHIQRAPVLNMPDAAMSERLAGLSASLLLAADSIDVNDPDSPVQVSSAVARALSRLGLQAEANRLVVSFDERQGGRGDIGRAVELSDSVADTACAVAAMGDYVSFSGDAALATGLAPVVAGGLEFLQRSAKRLDVTPWAAVFKSGAALLAMADEPRAATAATKQWEKFGSLWPPSLPALRPLPAVSAGADLLPSDPLRLAAEALQLVEGLVRVRADWSLDLLSTFPADWLGQSLDVRQVPTPVGVLSFAVRWHGARPALLWEFTGDSFKGFPMLGASSLDPTWVGTGRSGEALLQAPAPR